MKIKVLFLDALIGYFNPTRNLLPALLGEVFDLHCYGPGYIDSSELQKGCRTYLNDEGPFDAVISTAHAAFARYYPQENISKKFIHYARSFPDRDFDYLVDMYETLIEYGGPKFVTMIESDTYNFSIGQIESLKEVDGYTVGWGPGSVISTNSLANLRDESFGKRANDNYFEFIQGRLDRIIEFHHYVTEHEVCWTPLANRSTSWSILGAMYRARRIAIEGLKDNGITVSTAHYGFPFELVRRFRLLGFPTRSEQAFVNYAFRRKMQMARYGYTCGSALRYPIRKYFEIPAAGAVLVCDPCAGFEDLGFVDGENAIVCEPHDVHKVHEFLENEPEQAQQIAANGRALVLDRHVVGARARQLRECLEAIIDGSFAGSRWHKGRFEVIRKKERSPQDQINA